MNTQTKDAHFNEMTPAMAQAALYAAFVRAQAEMKNAPLNKKNPHFKSKYADLVAVREAVLPALNRNGIGVMQMPMTDESGNNVLVTTLVHELGGMIQSYTPVCADLGKPQAYMAALTYARRAGLAAFATISADEDDDGNAAQAAAEQTSAEQADPRFITEDQEAELSSLITQSGADKSAYLNYLGIATLSELPLANFPNAKAALVKKINAAQEKAA